MGLFDGKQPSSLSGTTAEMALWLDAPVVLVLDGSSIAGSAAAVVHGFDTLIPDVPLAAVVCNRVASVRHYELLREAITARCRPVPIGYLPRDLGSPFQSAISAFISLTKRRQRTGHPACGLDRGPSESRAPVAVDRRSLCACRSTGEGAITSPRRARIGIARDAAFCFYYEDNLTLLRGLGAELVEFSPIADRALPPEWTGSILGGGYPELHAPALSANTSMQAALREFAAGDAPVYAECGGFMDLTEAIVDVDGRRWPMAGLFPTSARMQKRLAKLGYVQVETQAGGPWLKSGEWARGHEFRYSTIDPMPATIQRVYRDPAEGYRVRSVLGSYVHLHFRSCPAFATRFVEACRQGL